MAGAGDIRAGRAFVELAIKDQLTAGLSVASKKLRGFGDSAMAIGGTIARAGAAVTAFGVALASAFIPAVKAAADAEQLEVAFTTMLKSADKAKELIADIRSFAIETPFESKEIAQSAKMLMSYGFAADESMEALKMLGDVAAGVSAPLQDIAYLYGTSRTQGRLFAVDIRQFANRGIPIIEALAKQFGVANNEVTQLVSDGKVGFEDLEKALKSMTGEGGQFQNLMEAQSKTLAGRWSSFQDALELTAIAIGEALMPTLKAMLERAFSAADAFRAFITQNQELAVTVAKVALGIVAAGAAITGLGVAIIGVGAVAAGIVSTITAIGTAAAFIATPLGAAVAAIAAVGAAFAATVAAVAMRSQEFRDAVTGSFTTLKNDLSDISQGISTAFFAGDTDLAWQIAMDGLKLLWHDTLDAMLNMATEFAQGFAEILIDSLGPAQDAFDAIMDPKAFLAKKAASGLSGAFGSGTQENIAEDNRSWLERRADKRNELMNKVTLGRLEANRKKLDKETSDAVVPAGLGMLGGAEAAKRANEAATMLSTFADEMVNEFALAAAQAPVEEANRAGKIELARQKVEEDEQADWIANAAGTVYSGMDQDVEDESKKRVKEAEKLKKAREDAVSTGTFSAFAAAAIGRGGKDQVQKDQLKTQKEMLRELRDAKLIKTIS